MLSDDVTLGDGSGKELAFVRHEGGLLQERQRISIRSDIPFAFDHVHCVR